MAEFIPACRILPPGDWRHPETGDVLTMARQVVAGDILRASDVRLNGVQPEANEIIPAWVADILAWRVEPEAAQ